MKESWIVVGGGFGGIVASYLLAKSGRSVTLVEESPRLGGLASGVRWGDFSLDLGCHIFGNTDDRTTEVLLDLMGGNVQPVHMRFASRFGGQVLEGFELPEGSRVADAAPHTSRTVRPCPCQNVV